MFTIDSHFDPGYDLAKQGNPVCCRVCYCSLALALFLKTPPPTCWPEACGSGEIMPRLHQLYHNDDAPCTPLASKTIIFVQFITFHASRAACAFTHCIVYIFLTVRPFPYYTFDAFATLLSPKEGPLNLIFRLNELRFRVPRTRTHP